MKAFGKLFGDLVGWRWAPAVGLCVASLTYVLVVVALVPEEIGVPMGDARFTKKLAAPPAEAPELPTYPTEMPEPEVPAPAPPPPVQPAAVVDFGRRGFSPPLERAEPPPAPVAPPPPVAPAPVAVAPPAPPPVAPAPAAEAPVAAAPAPSAAAPPQRTQAGFMRMFPAIRGLVPGAPAPTPGAPAPAQPPQTDQSPTPPAAPAPPAQ